MSDETLKETPLADIHRALGARLVPFAGYAMPVSYAEGIMAEHRHCRAAASLFDVSHMGQIELRPRSGGSVEEVAVALERLVTADLVGLAPGRQRYALMTGDEGGVLDDLMVANLGDRLLVVANAACKEADLARFVEALPECAVSLAYERALVALQGPGAGEALAAIAPETAAMRFMDVAETHLGDVPAFVARSGYTGEDGFEIAVSAGEAGALFDRLLGLDAVAPAGLGARDTLRLEAGLCLMGQDLDATTSPVEAGLGWAVGRARRAGGEREGGFPGAARVLAEMAEGPPRRRVGLMPEGRAPVRAGATLSHEGRAVGRVTSGGFSPTLERPVAVAYVESALAEPGVRLDAEQRGRAAGVVVTRLPFVEGRRKRD